MLIVSNNISHNEREKIDMTAFVNVFLSYLLLLLLIVAVAGIAAFIGITMRKKKNAESMKAEAEDNE